MDEPFARVVEPRVKLDDRKVVSLSQRFDHEVDNGGLSFTPLTRQGEDERLFTRPTEDGGCEVVDYLASAERILIPIFDWLVG